MSNYYGSARTNYVTIENMEGLVQALADFDIEISAGDTDTEGKHCFLSDDDGGWPCSTYDDDDNEIEFSFEEIIMPYVKEGECLVSFEVGSEKLRYLNGYSIAYVRKGETVESTAINLNNIYKQAQEELGCENITFAEY